MILILSGYIGSGKDTIANYISTRYNYKKFAFADYLKELCSHLYNVPINNFEDRQLKDTIIPFYKKSPRELCIKIGNNARKRDENIFAKHIGNLITGDSIISDARFPNEINYIKQQFKCVKTIWVNRLPKSNTECEGLVDNIEYDYTIDNTSTIEHLYSQIDFILTK